MARKSQVHKVLRIRGQKIAYTNTSRIPDAEIKKGLRWLAREIDLDKTVFHFKKIGDRSRRYGRAYPGIPSIASLEGLERSEWRYLAIVSDGRGYEWGWFQTLAHEAKHIEQFRRGTLYREKRHRNCEAQAEAFAEWALTKYREACGKVVSA